MSRNQSGRCTDHLLLQHDMKVTCANGVTALLLDQGFGEKALQEAWHLPLRQVGYQ